MEPFVQFIQYFPTEYRAKISPQILKIYLDKDKNDKIRDPVKVHAMLSIAKSANDFYFINDQDVNSIELI